MTRYAVIELGKALGLWLVAAIILVAGAGLLLWLVALAGAHGLAFIYRCRGYRSWVVRDGIALQVRRLPLRSRPLRPITDAEYAEFAARWRAEHGDVNTAWKVEILK